MCLNQETQANVMIWSDFSWQDQMIGSDRHCLSVSAVAGPIQKWPCEGKSRDKAKVWSQFQTRCCLWQKRIWLSAICRWLRGSVLAPLYSSKMADNRDRSILTPTRTLFWCSEALSDPSEPQNHVGNHCFEQCFFACARVYAWNESAACFSMKSAALFYSRCSDGRLLQVTRPRTQNKERPCSRRVDLVCVRAANVPWLHCTPQMQKTKQNPDICKPCI